MSALGVLGGVGDPARLCMAAVDDPESVLDGDESDGDDDR
jgi:hypothetical protein